jgi:hypothetical protein
LEIPAKADTHLVANGELESAAFIIGARRRAPNILCLEAPPNEHRTAPPDALR